MGHLAAHLIMSWFLDPPGQRAGDQGAECDLAPGSCRRAWRGAHGEQTQQRTADGIAHQAYLLPIKRGHPPGYTLTNW